MLATNNYDVGSPIKLLRPWAWIQQLQIMDRMVISTFSEAISNIAAVKILQLELSLMGMGYSNEYFITLHGAKLVNTDNFKLI